MTAAYTIRRAGSPADVENLKSLYTDVFQPEQVGVFAETIFHHLPGMKNKYWFIAEDKSSHSIAAAFALIPWRWELAGVQLKIAELGIVATDKKHRRRGLMRALNKEFDQTLEAEGFDLAVIQGIPGFYNQFGYFYAVDLENHINLPLHAVPEVKDNACRFRRAKVKDISLLMSLDEVYRSRYALTSVRSREHWNYLLTDSQTTEYGSEYWIIEGPDRNQNYCRLPLFGFGSGLIVSEISEQLPITALDSVFSFFKERAIAREKPYIRLNLYNESPAARAAIALGAGTHSSYAWQIKIPDYERLLTTLKPLLERRIQAGGFRGFSGILRLDFYKASVDLHWKKGELKSIMPGKDPCKHTFAMGGDLFPALCLGHRSWREMRRPDIIPGSHIAALLVDTLFPPCQGWIHEQY